MYKALSRIYPAFVRDYIKRLIRYSDLKIESVDFIGFAFFSSIALALFFSFIISGFAGFVFPHIIYLALAFFVISQLFFYFLILFRADSKAKFIEDILPDALQLIASNLKAGFTVERALFLSTRPEFGAFSDELSVVGREITTGKNIEDALLEMTNRVKSEKLTKTISLIVYGIQSGGELAMLLNQTAQNLRNQMLVEERVRVSVLMYFIFILSAVAFGAPILFALSSFLAEVFTKQLSAVQIPPGVAAPIMIKSVQITSNFILGFIIITLVTLCMFGSIALGMIRKGKGKEGIKYFPILLFFSLGLFFVVRTIIANIFSGLF